MTNSKSTKRALVSSALAILMCVAMLIGTTFAWFTDTASTGVNKIQAGNLDVALEMQDANGNWVSAEGKTLNFKKAAEHENEEILWEPGCRYELPELRVVNKGNLALKYKIQITGIQGDAKLNEVIDWTITGTDVSDDGYAHLAANDAKVITILGEMRTTAGNEYQGLSIDGIAITVFATQDTVEYDSFNNTYDAEAGKDTAIYTLSEFNALTEIPAGIKNVYLNIGAVSLKNGSVVIGNDNIRDKYARGEHAGAGGIYDTTYTDKDGINLIILGGTIKDGPAVDNNAQNKIAFRIPNKSTVTFQGTKIEGFFGLSGATTDNPYGTVMSHKIESVTFDNCTFDGLWLQNGSFATKEIKLTGCTFNKFENSFSADNTSPIWFKNIGQQDGTNVSIDKCVFNTNRPIKLAEEVVTGQTISITNCKFNMEADAENKNVAIMFSTKGTLGNVLISGNTVENGTALICFYNADYVPVMADGATFTLSGNTLNGAKTSVLWKTTDEFKPDFVTVK